MASERTHCRQSQGQFPHLGRQRRSSAACDRPSVRRLHDFSASRSVAMSSRDVGRYPLGGQHHPLHHIGAGSDCFDPEQR